MTTIVYRDGILAADTRAMCGDTILPDHVRKVRRLRDGRLVAICGDMSAGQKLIEHLLDATKAAPPEGCTGSLVIGADGKCFTAEDGVLLRWRGPYMARGSGKAYALGALAMGATAIQAVQAAMKFDASTGGRVQHVALRR